MYHFGQWNKTATILDPRLPTGLCNPGEFTGKDNSIFCVTPAEWHHSDITYGGETAGAAGTTAKARIVACLQRFTQRSAQTGKELHRSTYVQHTKIARWRSSEKREDAASGPGAAPLDDHMSGQSDALSSPENMLRTVPNVSDVWKQCARSPLGGDESGLVISPSSLSLCPYNRLQILQSLCPAAATAIMILGGQMPEMRSENCPNQSPCYRASTVTAEAWCPRTLMTSEGIEDLLLFSMPDGLDVDSSSSKQNCLLRGGTLDGLLVYALKIFRKSTPDTYESLISNIFIQLYPTFTIPMEVVNRLIQRYLAFVPIEPGGLGCIEVSEKEMDFDVQWSEALNILQFLHTLLTRTERRLYDCKLETKIIRFAQLLKVDARIAEQKSSGRNVCVIDESEDENLVCFHTDPNDSKLNYLNPIAAELNRISECLIDLLPLGGLKGGILEQPTDKNHEKAIESTKENSKYCTCQKRLNRFLLYGVKELAEQITAMEEVFFDSIKIYELINIKDLEKGNTPTLSRCVQHFNDLNSMVRCLIRMAKELGQPLPKCQPMKPEDNNPEDKQIGLVQKCSLCGLEKESLAPNSPVKESQPKVSGNTTSPRRNSLKSYLCMSPITQNSSMSVRKRNFILEKTLSHLCDLAEVI
ncbi:unnamed protein product [Rodentolepis nana]|uniref:N-terminal Ras-GEF domain-containing protein n=1 Tax=Rodentolepis nana TaxID=102285 RepID=A0A0R3TN53_RODNA|nr:unnamed protein product [Rodentolepis nana]